MTSEQDNTLWKLHKYARFEGESLKDSWKFFDNQTEQLNLVLTSSKHLVITHGQQILENLSLWNAMSWVKGVSKGDSMLFVCKFEDKHHKFRIKFAGREPSDGVENCSSCILKLCTYFPVKRINVNEDGEAVQNEKSSAETVQQDELSGEVDVGKLAQVLTENSKALPSAYRSIPPITDDSMNTLLKLCLTDANFPSFVGQVEKALGSIKQS